MHRIGYVQSSQPLDYEHELLDIWGISNVEVFEAPVDDMAAPAPGSLAGADGVVVEWGSMTRDVIVANPRLRVIANMAIGYDNVDVATATAHSVYVTNVPGYCTYGVALHTLGLIVDLYKKITWRDRQVRLGTWDDMAGYRAPRPAGKTCGLVYFGSIPKALVPMLRAIGMDVLVYAPTKTRDYLGERGCTKVDSIDDLFMRSDVVSLHCPLTAETANIVNEHTLSLMQPSAFVVNTARGGCVDEEALATALANGTITAAAVDVIRDETNAKSPLIGLDNCIVTPHAAYLSTDSYLEMRRRALENALAGVSGEVPTNAVNRL